MKYTNKFEEMIESRMQAIDNLRKVTAEQIKLLTFLSSTEESKKEFKDLIKSLTDTVNKNQKDIDGLVSANKRTESLVRKFKKCGEDENNFIEELLEELGIFNTSEAPKES